MSAEGLTLPIVFFAGIISFLSPCVLPLVPPYLCFITGESIDTLTQKHHPPSHNIQNPIWPAIWFVIGFSFIFIALGAAASYLGQFLLEHLALLARIAGIIIIIMGVHFLGLFKIPLLYRQWKPNLNLKPQEHIKKEHIKKEGTTALRAFTIGTAFAFGWTPCIGPILAAILAISAVEATIGKGIMLLTLYSAGLAIPFLIAAAATGQFFRFATRFRKYLHIIEKITGIFLIITGILFITGAFTEFSWWILELFPVLATIG